MATQSNQPLGSINEEGENDPNNTSKTQKSGKESSSKSQKTSFGGLKKLIDRDKDKDKEDKDKDDKDKEKKEKKEGRSTSVLKTGLSETKENVKKLIQGGKDKSSKSSSSTPTVSTQQQQQQPPSSPMPAPLQTTVVHQTSLEYDNHQNSNNGDLMKNSPMVLKRAELNSSENVPIDMNMTTFNDKSLPDIVNMSKIDSNGSHGILSPFESMEDSDSEEGGIEPIEHQQLSSSSSASINILMDNSNNNNKIMGTNVQVSQV